MSVRREPPGGAPAIAVIGEALIDLIVGRDGDIAPRPGGGPLNTARTLARLGVPPVFCGRLSGDRFGRMLRAGLDKDGVPCGIPAPGGLPTTLTVADVGEDGAARYGFYLSGTAAADVDYQTLRDAVHAASRSGLSAAHVGTLGLVMEPIASSVERLVTTALPPEALLMIDPNCRPAAIADRDAYLGRLGRIMPRADIVKASAEDLAYLWPGVPAAQAATALLDQGAALVLVTDGPRPARGFARAGNGPPEVAEICVNVPRVDVVDTIGAGDALGGAFLAKWLAAGRTRAHLGEAGAIRESLAFATEVAALTCTRAGAEPPYLAELALTWPLGLIPAAHST